MKAKPNLWLLGLKVWFEQLMCLAASESVKGLLSTSAIRTQGQHCPSGHPLPSPSLPPTPLLFSLRGKMLASIQVLESHSLAQLSIDFQNRRLVYLLWGGLFAKKAQSKL